MLTLSALRAHLVERGSASLDELALHFDADPAAVRDALGRFEAKGRVARLAETARCGSCSGHDCHATEIWEWREGASSPAPGFRNQ
ncbi:FeoC-like transcriptional regulator [Pinisolibacter sp.]|uniref:FeoC-like transcriptional regulator n=1 Tax=Pinisolibacter sp. TaxID=2172024 RepID=UPI002FDE025E